MSAPEQGPFVVRPAERAASARVAANAWEQASARRHALAVKSAIGCAVAALALVAAQSIDRAHPLWGCAAIADVIAALGLYSHLKLLRAPLYYTLPGSRDPQGQHRCVFCGSRALSQKSEHRMNRTHCSCARCGHYLYTQWLRRMHSS